MFSIGNFDPLQAARSARQAAEQAAGAAGEALGQAAGAVAGAVGAAAGAVSQASADAALATSRAVEGLAGDGGLLDTPPARLAEAAVEGLNDLFGVAVQAGFGAVEGPRLQDLRGRCQDVNSGAAVQRRHDDPEDHEHYAMLSEVIYSTDNPDSVADPEKLAALEAAGYSKVEGEELDPLLQQHVNPATGRIEDPETGLEAEVWVQVDPETGERTYVLVFEGTQMTEDGGADWGANFQNAFGFGVPAQHEQALELALDFQEAYGDEGDLVVAGHSLGGGLATFAGLGAGIETVTFSPSGLGPASYAYLDSMGLVDRNEHLVQNYVHRGEVLNILRAGSSYLWGPLSQSMGHLILVGDVERFGDYEDPGPISAHNDLDLDEVG